MGKCVALRADIDTVKDAEVLPVLLAILDEYKLKATFFVTTGRDKLAKNLRNYRNPLRLIKKIPRYGLTPILYSLIFKTNPNFIAVLDDFRFRYSSDYVGEKAFYPEVNGKRMKTLQVHVSMRSFGELEDEGLGDDQIYKVTADAVSRLEFLVLYLHPSYEPIFKRKLLERVLTYFADRSKVVTMSQIAEQIRLEGRD